MSHGPEERRASTSGASHVDDAEGKVRPYRKVVGGVEPAGEPRALGDLRNLERRPRTEPYVASKDWNELFIRNEKIFSSDSEF